MAFVASGQGSTTHVVLAPSINASPSALADRPFTTSDTRRAGVRPEATYWSTGTWITAYPSYYEFDGQENVEGMATDRSGDLFVANSVAGTIEEYPPGGAANPTNTLIDPGQAPMSVAVCPDGTIYAANRTPEYGTPLVTVYEPGASSPTTTFTQPGAAIVWTVACDRESNVYVSWTQSEPPSPQFIVKYAPGGVNGVTLKAAPNPLTFMIDFAVDNKGVLAMLVYDQSSGYGEVDFISQNKTKPERVISGLDNPHQLAFDADSQDLVWTTQTVFYPPLDTPYPQVVEYTRSGREVLNLAQQFTTYGIASGVLPKQR